MIIIQGKYNNAKVFTNKIDETAYEQIVDLCDSLVSENSKIRIMPDVHAGAGCTIGTTMTLNGKVVPNLVGVDIGCGMEVVRLDGIPDFDKLDKVVHDLIPSGFNVRSSEHKNSREINYEKLNCFEHIDIKRAKLSIGTLGGGNHFIEVNRGEKGDIYLVIHSGSRNPGKQTAEFYQKKAASESRKRKSGEDRSLAYLEGELFNLYLEDMKFMQRYADINRKTIAEEIINAMGFIMKDSFSTIHNYIDTDSMILRKGAISAAKKEIVLIPVNMRDGSLLCEGKGNIDWNCSAPHGAGRIMSRRQARAQITMDVFRQTMKGIYSSTVDRTTIDECAFAYKSMDELLGNIEETVNILDIIKPLYNFKACE